MPVVPKLSLTGKGVDKLEKHERVNYTAELLSQGLPTFQICGKVAETYNVSRRTVERYIKAARELMIADMDVDRKAYTAQMIHQSQRTHQAAFENKQYGICTQERHFQAKVLGLGDQFSA